MAKFVTDKERAANWPFLDSETRDKYNRLMEQGYALLNEAKRHRDAHMNLSLKRRTDMNVVHRPMSGRQHG